MSMKALYTTVSGADTATQLTATRTPCAFAIISAARTNLDAVLVGDSTAKASTDRGFFLSSTAGFLGQTFLETPGPNPLDLRDVYIVSNSPTAKVTVLYIEI